jgi:putative FmdB family regulatory protein
VQKRETTMPTYEYQCGECGIRFEKFQHFSEEPVKICPECSGAVHRVIHPVGIIFKGSGWYVTDNKASTAPLMPKSEAQTEGKEEGAEKKPAVEGKTEAAKESTTPEKPAATETAKKA